MASLEFSSSSPAGAGPGPPNRFVCKLIEGGNSEGEMLFLRVLDLVVADAVEALHEHHDGGDAEAGDFGGVVEGAGGETMRFGAGLGDGFVAEGDEVGVEVLGAEPARAHRR